MKKHLKYQKGQALVEFALILPLLLVITIGTLYFCVYFMNKSRMNGIAFQAARAAAVRDDNYMAGQDAVQRYQQKTDQAWVEKIQVSDEFKDNSYVKVELTKEAEQYDFLANALDLISGGVPYKAQDITVRSYMVREWIPGITRPQTYTTVNYRYKKAGSMPWLKLLDGLPDILFNTEQMSDSDLPISEREESIGLEPPNINLREFYADRGWGELDYRSYTEKESGQMRSLRLIGDNFKAIELGGSIFDFLADFSLVAGPVKDILGAVGSEAAEKVEQVMTLVSTSVDEEIRDDMVPMP